MKARRPIDGQFVPHRLALLESYAWRSLSGEAHLTLHRIEIEHLRHGGKENGDLVVLYDHFLAYVGGHRRGIARALRDLEALGLIRVVRGRAGNGEFRTPSKYRLTYLPSGGQPPTDEWREITSIGEAKSRLGDVKRRRKPSVWLHTRTSKVVPFPASN
jgi:hypothetical protein